MTEALSSLDANLFKARGSALAAALKHVETGRVNVEDLRFRAGLETARQKQIPPLRDQSAIFFPGENNRL
jgi:hypothetical protein